MSGFAQVSRVRGGASLTVFTLCAFGILIALGVWQLERRTWKNDLIARFEAGLSQPPATYRPGANEFSHVRVKGEFLNPDTMKLLTPTPETARAKTREGFGYQLFTPMKFDGGVVFVNRGFVPENLAATPSLFPEGVTEIAGIVRVPAKPGWFTPPPEPLKRVFFDADIPEMAAVAGLKTGDVIEREYIQAAPVPNPSQWPEPRDPSDLLASIPNRHLEYALTWFGLAAALAGVYAAYMLRR
jgi:surfeit locus 1 family protein